jgi:hypothetical protein
VRHLAPTRSQARHLAPPHGMVGFWGLFGTPFLGPLVAPRSLLGVLGFGGWVPSWRASRVFWVCFRGSRPPVGALSGPFGGLLSLCLPRPCSGEAEQVSRALGLLQLGLVCLRAVWHIVLASLSCDAVPSHKASTSQHLASTSTSTFTSIYFYLLLLLLLLLLTYTSTFYFLLSTSTSTSYFYYFYFYFLLLLTSTSTCFYFYFLLLLLQRAARSSM